MPHQPKVLVVDDDREIISAFGDFLKKEHCTMLSAFSAEEAFDTVLHQPVNLVITDVRMKWQSGVTLLLKIRQTHPNLPVIVITGYPNLIPEKDLHMYGANYYFLKPLDLARMRKAVRKCLQDPLSSSDSQWQ